MSDTPKTPPLSPADLHYRELIRSGLDHMSEAAKEMNDFVAARRRKVPEPYFANVLLPIIRDHVTGKAPQNLGIWLNVADGMHNRMDIVDDEGNILFTAPPAFNNIPDRSTRPDPNDRQPTIAQLVERQGDLIDNGDMRGSMDIDQRILEQCAPRPEDDEATENLVLLIRVYQRYNLPLKELLGEAAEEIAELLRTHSPTASTQGSNDDDAGAEPTLIY